MLNVTKFSYLEELTVTSVHASIERLPFTKEGYQCKKYSADKIWQISDVVKSHVQHIMQLPVVFGKNKVKESW